MEDKKRDYKKEAERDKSRVRVYRVKVPLHLANALDEKLKKDGLTYSSVALNAIIEYLKKS